MEIKEELQQFLSLIENLKDSIIKLKKYKGNSHYKTQYNTCIKELNRAHKFFIARVTKYNKPSLNEKSAILDSFLSEILAKDNYYDEKLEAIENLQRFWPDLEIEFEDIKLNIRSFEISDTIPMNEIRLDLEEAIKDYDNLCWYSAISMCRRAYEGALIEAYNYIEKTEPVSDLICKKCGAVVRERSFMSIVELHKWALSNGVVDDILKNAGFLVTDLGAGSSHPKEMKRDREFAKLAITSCITLTSQVYDKLNKKENSDVTIMMKSDKRFGRLKH